MSDNGAKFIKSMRDEITALRRIARKAFHSERYATGPGGEGLTREELDRIGIYGG